MSDALTGTAMDDNDNTVLRTLRTRLKDAKREAAALREANQTLRADAVRAVAFDVGLKDPRHVAAVARLHPDDAEVTADAVRGTLRRSGLAEAFGLHLDDGDG